MKKSRYREEQIIGFLKQADAGMPIKGNHWSGLAVMHFHSVEPIRLTHQHG